MGARGGHRTLRVATVREKEGKRRVASAELPPFVSCPLPSGVSTRRGFATCFSWFWKVRVNASDCKKNRITNLQFQKNHEFFSSISAHFCVSRLKKVSGVLDSSLKLRLSPIFRMLPIERASKTSPLSTISFPFS